MAVLVLVCLCSLLRRVVVRAGGLTVLEVMGELNGVA